MDAEAPNSRNLVYRTAFSDPADGRFNNRIIAQFVETMKVTDLPQSYREAIEELLIVIALKFASIWAHNQRYEKRENELIEEARKNPIDRRQEGPVRFATAQELYIEFDGFLVQIKSALDHMINLLHDTHGLGFGSLSTFRDKGHAIIKLLRKKVVIERRRPQSTNAVFRNRERASR